MRGALFLHGQAGTGGGRGGGSGELTGSPGKCPTWKNRSQAVPLFIEPVSPLMDARQKSVCMFLPKSCVKLCLENTCLCQTFSGAGARE